MKSLEYIKQTLAKDKQFVHEKYQISELGIFGSYARGEQNEESNLDVVIDYAYPPTLIDLIQLEEYFSEQLGIKVDVATKNGLKYWGRERILEEAIYV